MLKRITHFLNQILQVLKDFLSLLQTDPTKKPSGGTTPEPRKPKQKDTPTDASKDTSKGENKDDVKDEAKESPKEKPKDKPKEKPKDTPSVEDDKTKAGKGYDGSFLSFKVALPKLAQDDKVLLKYRNFSIVMNPERRMPYFTAVNIDGVKYNKLKPNIPSRKEMGADTWIFDPRLAKDAQLEKSFYSKNDFDLGHMVRREDALWGDTLEDALAANDDTFFLTNATPQHKDFNRNAKRWKGLEDAALKSSRKEDLKITVFTGCIFEENDRSLKGVQVPAKFWKVIVMVNKGEKPTAVGFIVNQDDLIKDITEEHRSLFYFEPFKTYQVPVKTIEAETGVTFGLNEYDPLQTNENKWGVAMEMPILIEDDDEITF